MGNMQIAHSAALKECSSNFLLYAGAASLWFSLFVRLDNELRGKRWLTKKERNFTYLAYLFVSIICCCIKGFPVEHLAILSAVSLLWLIVKSGDVYTSEEDLYAQEPLSSDPYYYENDQKTLSDFGADVHWYNNKLEKQLQTTYIRTAKEFSGKNPNQKSKCMCAIA